MRLFHLALHNYTWFRHHVQVLAYDEKQARKRLRKKIAKEASVPSYNSIIKYKNVKVKKYKKEEIWQ